MARARKTVEQLRSQPRRRATKRQFDRWLDDEQLFHQLLVDASRNPLLKKVVDEHRAISRVFEAQRSDPRLLTAEVAEHTCDSKALLLQALRERDSKSARQLMSEQIQRGREMVVEYLHDQPSDG